VLPQSAERRHRQSLIGVTEGRVGFVYSAT